MANALNLQSLDRKASTDSLPSFSSQLSHESNGLLQKDKLDTIAPNSWHNTNSEGLDEENFAAADVTNMKFTKSRNRPSRYLSNPRTHTLILSILLLLVGSYSVWQTFHPTTTLSRVFTADALISDKSAWPLSLLAELYAPIIVPIGQQSFKASDGKEYTIKDGYWNSALKNEILILDMDNRNLDTEAEFLHDETLAWDQVNNPASGLLNHYAYGMLQS